MKFKRKTSTKIMYCPDGEKYVFKNGVAIMKGCFHSLTGKPYTITMKEFLTFKKTGSVEDAE